MKITKELSYKCCKELKVYWYCISTDAIYLMCHLWISHDKKDFIKLGEL